MSNTKPGGTDESSNNPEESIKITDLPVEEGSDGTADQVKGGGYVLKNVMVTSSQPPRP